MYDPVPANWTTRASLLSPRSGQGAAEVNGKLYIFGGASAAGVAADTTDVYDPATDSWTRLTPRLNIPRLGPGGCAALGKLYCVGGVIPPSNTPSAVTEELLAPPPAFYIMIKN
jgi:N-acetylneuraminic acid mutarotase